MLFCIISSIRCLQNAWKVFTKSQMRNVIKLVQITQLKNQEELDGYSSLKKKLKKYIYIYMKLSHEFNV